MGCPNSRPTNHPSNRPHLAVRKVSGRNPHLDHALNLRNVSPRPMTDAEYEEYKARNKGVGGGMAREQKHRVVRDVKYSRGKVVYR